MWLRTQFALVYENGGIHSGAGIGLLMWFSIFTGYLWKDLAVDEGGNRLVLAINVSLVLLLLGIIIGAMPQLRRKYHNFFEVVHRWGCWMAIALLWIGVVQVIADETKAAPGKRSSFGMNLIKMPAFWMLVFATTQAIYPWINLRKVAVTRFERLSDHAARVYFSPGERIAPLRGIAISDAPWREWHGFAAIADDPHPNGSSFSIVVSRAGDWTSRMIDSPKPYYYMRGVHSIGMVAMAKLFRSIVFMGTGSGVGPCLAVKGLLPNTKVRFIWSTPSPEQTFGHAICKQVEALDPHALVWDTRLPGQKRPDLTRLAYEIVRREGIEAVFFISNQKLTRKVIRELRQRGVPAFAPVFDS